VWESKQTTNRQAINRQTTPIGANSALRGLSLVCPSI
jgi:hypothetical protein